jgi:glyoxylase-like metal-dependent hydrolase (beta-lactamase superfamily II)
MRQIITNLYTFTRLLVGRVYMIEDRDGLTIIDAGIGFAAERIVKQLEWRRHKANDVKRIIVTHAHPDHIGGLPKLKELTGAQVICSAVERPYVQGEQAAPIADPATLPPLAKLMASGPAKPQKGTPVDRVLADGEVMSEVFGGLTAIYTPGHSPGHMALWQPEKKVLFTGDVLMNVPRGLRLPFAAFTTNMDEDKRSLKRIAMLDSQVVCFGHGVPLMEGAAAQLRAFARRVGAV